MMQETEHGVKIKDVEFIWAKNSKEFLFSNSILVHGADAVIVDPSASFSYISNIASSRIIKTILNTHFHGDHRSLNHLFTDVHFASHEADADAISDFDKYAKIAVDTDKSYYLEWIKRVFSNYNIIDCPVSIRLKDNDVITTGAEEIQIIHTPGHTPGHIALYFKNADSLFVSDIDLTPYGPWYANPCSDIDEFKKSIRKVRMIECRYYISSHGERVYEREEFLKKIDRFYLAFEMRKFKILEILKETPMELHELCSHGIVYKKSLLSHPLRSYFQYQMVKKHIVQLVNEGKIIMDGDKFVYQSF